MGFEAEWLATRAPYDEAALDPGATAAIRAWAERLPPDRPLLVVDLGSGTGVALARVRRWLGSRRMLAYAVDQDADLLARAAPLVPQCDGSQVMPIVGDLLLPLEALGGPSDGTVDLVVGHALADLLPLDRLASRVAALLRPGGLAHLALVYDGETAFASRDDPHLPQRDRPVVAAFHRHMDRPASSVPGYGGSTAGRRLGAALVAAGLEVVADAPSVWHVRAGDGPGGLGVLARLIRFVAESAREVGGVPPGNLARWEEDCRAAVAAGTLTVRVGHRDLLARKPEPR